MTYHDLAGLPDWTDGLLGLMYHAVESPPLFHSHRGLYVEPSLLEQQLQELAEAGVALISLTDWSAREPSSGRQATVTFDDAFLDLRDNALPVLQKLGVGALTYVVAGKLGGTNDWDAAAGAQLCPLMDRADLLAWQAAGQEIGSHGMTHAHLTRVPLAQARAEIFDSKKKLEDLAGCAVRHFCYPYGDVNPAIRDLVGEAGYRTATTTERGINGADADPLLLRRFPGSHRKPYQAAVRGALLRMIGLGSRRPRRASAAQQRSGRRWTSRPADSGRCAPSGDGDIAGYQLSAAPRQNDVSPPNLGSRRPTGDGRTADTSPQTPGVHPVAAIGPMAVAPARARTSENPPLRDPLNACSHTTGHCNTRFSHRVICPHHFVPAS